MMIAVLLLAAATSSFVPENAVRVREIADLLPAKPAMVDPKYAAAGKKTDVGPAEREMGREVPPFPDDLYLEYFTNGNRSHYQDWRARFLKGLSVLVSAETSERKGRFVPAIVARLEALCDWPSWVFPAHDGDKANYERRRPFVDLVSSDLARSLARTLWALRDALPAKTVARVRREIDARVLTPYLERPQEHWWFFGHNNWNAVCHAGCVIAALSLVEDRTTRARFVEGAERGLESFMEFDFDPDGYCSEGMGYWNYGFGRYLELGLAVRSATGGKVDYLAHPRAVKAMRYAAAYQMNEKTSPLFSDGNGVPAPDVVGMGLGVWPELAAEFGGRLPLRSEFPDGQVWLMRLPPEDGGTFALALKGGHNAEHHNHNDIGSYNVMIGGELVAGDVGYEIYTARTFSGRRYESKVINSYGHPVPQVGGRLQMRGREFAAKVLRTEFTAARDTVVLDLRGGYECPALSALERTFAFDRTSRTITVTDRVRFTEPTAFESPVTTVRPDLLKPHLSISAAGGAWERADEDIPNPGLQTVRRIAVRFTEPVTEATVTFTFRE